MSDESSRDFRERFKETVRRCQKTVYALRRWSNSTPRHPEAKTMPNDPLDCHTDRSICKPIWKPVCDSHASETTDSELMNELNASRCQDDRPLRVLMVRHERLVLNVLRGRGVRGADTEDVAAAVWFRVARLAQQGRWDPLRAVHTTDPFVPLVKKIAVNLARDFHRRAKSRKKQLKKLEQAARLFGNDWRRGAVSKTRQRQARQSVAPGVPQSLVSVMPALPEDLRRAYELHAAGVGCREIGKQLGCSAATAHRRVRRASQEIKTISLKSTS